MTMEHGTLVLKNYMINTLVELLSTPIAGQLARSRNRFIAKLSDIAHKLEDERIVLLKKYGELKDGELQIDQETGSYKLTDKAAFEKEFEVLSKGTFELACKAEQLIDFKAVHQMLDTIQTPMTVATTTVYDEIMKAFEAWAASQTV